MTFEPLHAAEVRVSGNLQQVNQIRDCSCHDHLVKGRREVAPEEAPNSGATVIPY